MHIPYENGGGTGKKDDFWSAFKEYWYHTGKKISKATDRAMIEAMFERPEDPIDEVIQTTEEAWEKNDMMISGQRDKDLD